MHFLGVKNHHLNSWDKYVRYIFRHRVHRWVLKRWFNRFKLLRNHLQSAKRNDDDDVAFSDGAGGRSRAVVWRQDRGVSRGLLLLWPRRWRNHHQRRARPGHEDLRMEPDWRRFTSKSTLLRTDLFSQLPTLLTWSINHNLSKKILHQKFSFHFF